MKLKLFCEACEAEFILKYKGDDYPDPKFCPFCREELDTDWSADIEGEDHNLID